MQEEIEQKSAALMINGTKFSLRTLKSAALKLLAHRQNPSAPGVKHRGRYRQVLCANSFTSLAELSLHRAGKPALNYLAAEHRERVKATTRRKLFAIR